ncbi:MAG TPA: Mur ligase family protein, partial [Pirellulales bacterium]|nr:Mur ligase family protein [Pirellulales bacterium]
MDDWRNRRVTVLGLGRHGGGVGAVRWLAARGARVTVTDLADEVGLARSIAALEGVPIDRWRLGGHDEADFAGAEAVVVNPAIRPNHPLVEFARRSGAAITSEIELFLAVCPASVVAVTGTVGKSSTATMIARIFEAAGERTWLGGNLGGSLLDVVDRMTRDDRVVLELSSFQLFWLSRQARMPAAAVLTAFSPHHLDWHGSIEHYRAAKERLFREQTSDGIAVIGRGIEPWASIASGRVVSPLNDDLLPELTVFGAHQRSNAAIAAAVTTALGVSTDAVVHGLRRFRDLPHRLELIAEIGGRRFIDDSKSTSPAATLAALEACGPQTWLLAGGA